MNWAVLAGSLAAVLVMAGAAWLLGLGGAKLADADDARRTAEELLPGFTAGEARVDSTGEAAAVFGSAGDVAMVRRHGARFVARRLPRPLSVEQQGERLVVASCERRFGPVTMRLASEDDARELTRVLRAPVDARPS